MLKPILIAGLLGVNLSAWAVDWTPYLKSMQNECDFSIINVPTKALGDGNKTNIPKSLQPSIVSYAHTDEKTDVRLKNATAFGQPITRVVTGYLNGDTFFLTVHFANANFTQIKPQFSIDVDGKSYVVGTKQAWGVTYTETDQIDEDGEPVIDTSYTPISQQQKQQVQRHLSNDDQAAFDALLEIHENGWRYDTGKVFTSLSFDGKNNSLSCHQSI